MKPEEIPAAATHVALPGTQWSLWRQVVLRAPGFPARGVNLLASTELAAAADGLTERESDDARQWNRYRTVFDKETGQLSSRILELAAEPRLKLALAWQNHRIFDTAITPMLRNQASNHVRRNSKQRQHEELIANYWQRYCVKNDTIGFTGPVGWALLDPEAAATRLETGKGLTASSEVFFEPWIVDRLAAAVAAIPGMAQWIPPRKLPFVRFTDRRAVGPAGVSVELSAAESAVLGRCTGQKPARDIARECAGVTPDAATEEDVYSIITRLCQQRLLTWKLELPLSPHPERHLRNFLEHVGDPVLSAESLGRLDLLEKARDTAWAASHSDPAAFVSALRDLDETFIEVAGAQPSRRGGQTYGGRTLIYHDARRDAALTLGADFLTALRPLELLLDSARWLSYHFAARIQERFTGIAMRMTEGGTAPDLASFYFECMPVVSRSVPTIIAELQCDFQQRWAAILRIPPDVRQVRRDSAALREQVREAFDAPHSGWSGGRYCSPDLMIAASGVDAINQGDFDLILGETHLGFASSRHYCFVTQHPSPGDLLDCLAADSPGPRLLPVLPKENHARLTVRTSSALTRDMDFLAAVYAQTAEPGRPRLLNGADLTVTPGAAGPVVTIPGGPSFPVIDVLAEMLLDFFMDALEFVPRTAYQPRITIDRLVIVRESWRFDPTHIDFAQLGDEPARFAAARRWRHAAGLPRQVFVKVTGEVKPFFVDFDSVISVNILAKSLRRLQARPPGGPDISVQFSEMLPSTESLWLTDSTSDRYTSELRIVAVDQRPISSKQEE
jgi:lantibiotic biosynthesis dehydratase-like protein